MTGAPSLEIDALTKRFGGFIALNAVSLAIGEGERVGLIGPNGSGKSTLVNCIAGVLRPESGRIRFAGSDIGDLAPFQRTRAGIARSFQIPQPFASMSVIENLCIPLEYAGAGWKRRHGDIRAAAREILADCGLAAKAEALPASLTQIELRKLELARAVAAHPRLLIADEAMAGLSSAEVEEVLSLLFALSARGITIVMIEHIMHAVMRFSQRIVVLDAGRKIAEGKPDDIVRDPAVERAYLGE
jgi:branched-chain amino acid transport system ATP-binding protein